MPRAGARMKTFDISGFGGEYELCCQRMLTAGLKFLSDKASFDWKGYIQFQNIIGLTIAKNDDCKALDKAIIAAAGEQGATGTMHQAVVNHLHYISRHSYYGWIDEATKNRPESIYEIDDSERESLVRSVDDEIS
jgi:hypothetical protein